MCTARTSRWGWRGWGSEHFFRVLLWDGKRLWDVRGKDSWQTVPGSALFDHALAFWARGARAHKLGVSWSSHWRQLCIFLTTVTRGHVHKLAHTGCPICYHLSLHQWLQNQLCYLLAMLTRLNLWTDYESSGFLTEQIEITWSPYESHVLYCLSEIHLPLNCYLASKYFSSFLTYIIWKLLCIICNTFKPLFSIFILFDLYLTKSHRD